MQYIITNNKFLSMKDDESLIKFDIWIEGFLDQGMEGVPAKARHLGSEYGKDFVDACKRFMIKTNSPEDFKRYWTVLDDGTPCFWCRLYDNETDARKSFG